MGKFYSNFISGFFEGILLGGALSLFLFLTSQLISGGMIFLITVLVAYFFIGLFIYFLIKTSDYAAIHWYFTGIIGVVSFAVSYFFGSEFPTIVHPVFMLIIILTIVGLFLSACKIEEYYSEFSRRID